MVKSIAAFALLGLIVLAVLILVAVSCLGTGREPATIAPGASTPIGSSWSAPPWGESQGDSDED